MWQTPIESCFIKQLPDHLNAEIVSGTVTSIKEAVAWLRYTYLYIRMRKNPRVYGMLDDELLQCVPSRHLLPGHEMASHDTVGSRPADDTSDSVAHTKAALR
jgi:replicative superfamily II helicase